jgi:hypothetical protein
MLRKMTALGLVGVMLAQYGCYNTYNVSLTEMKKAQYGGDITAIQVSTEGGEDIVVSEDTKIGVTSRSGEYFAISPFNFTLDDTRLIAPDEGFLLSTKQIETGNVKQVSTGKTVGLVLGGLLAVIGGAVGIINTAGEKRAYSAGSP